MMMKELQGSGFRVQAVRPWLLAFLAGVVITALIAWVNSWGNDEHWRLEAYQHGYGVYYRYADEVTIRWAWMDDYLTIYREGVARTRTTEHAESYTPAPTPLPRERAQGRRLRPIAPTWGDDRDWL